GRERHLPAQTQHQGFEQQGESPQLARPRRIDESHRAVGQLHPWHPDLQKALVLEEVEMPVALRLRVVDRMLPGNPRVLEPVAGTEIHLDRQRPGLRVKPGLADIPGRIHAHRLFKQLLRLHLSRRLSHLSERSRHFYTTHSDFERGQKDIWREAVGHQRPEWDSLKEQYGSSTYEKLVGWLS